MSLVNYYKTFLKSFYQKIIPLVYQNRLTKLGLFYDTKWSEEKGEHMYGQ